MKRDWNSGSQKSDFRFKGGDVSPRTQKSKITNVFSNSDEDTENGAQSHEANSKKSFSSNSKTGGDSLIRNKSSNINDSDDSVSQLPKPSQRTGKTKSLIRKNSKGNDTQDENVKTTKNVKKHDELNLQGGKEKKKSQRKSRKKYVYVSDHSKIKLSVEKSFELERPRDESLSSSSRRKNSDNKMEIKLPGNHSQSSKKLIPGKQIKSKGDSFSNKPKIPIQKKKSSQSEAPSNGNFLIVGSGDNLKVILNVSKYYSDLGEKIVNEIINSSLNKIKHHDIILPEDDPNNKSNVIMKYEDESNSQAQNDHLHQIAKEFNDDNFMIVGTGDNLKVVLNISKYYNDLSEQISDEIIQNSLSQIKHHNILTKEAKQYNDNSYIFNYSEQDDSNINSEMVPSFSPNSNDNIESFPNSNKSRKGFSFPPIPVKNQTNSPKHEQKIPHEQSNPISKEQNNDNYMVVGSGDDMKVVLNISKYYTDIGNKFADDIISSSLTQVKHHDIILPEDEPQNKNDKNNESFPKTNPSPKSSFPSISSESQMNAPNDQPFALSTDQKHEDFMIVGSGDNLKVVLNISKYYTDLGEKVVNEVIKSSLTQIKHHDITLPEDEIKNKSNSNPQQVSKSTTASKDFAFPSASVNQKSSQSQKQKTENDQLRQIAEDYDNDNFMIVGNGDNLKVVLNIAKYYTDLSEQIANDVIRNSLSQIKHHDILSNEEKQFNNNNYIFNYSDHENNKSPQSHTRNKPAIKKSPKSSKQSKDVERVEKPANEAENNFSPQKAQKEAEKPLRRIKNKESDIESDQPKIHKRVHHIRHNQSESDGHNQSLTNVVKMVPVSEDDVLPLDDEIISSSRSSQSKSKVSRSTKSSKSSRSNETNQQNVKNKDSDSLIKVDDSLTISESKVKTKQSKNRIKNPTPPPANNNTNTIDNDAIMGSDLVSNDLEKGEKKRSKIVVIRSSGGQHRRSSNLESISESDILSGQPSYKKRPVNIRNQPLSSSHSQVGDSFENINIRKAKSTNILPNPTNLANEPTEQQQHLPPVAVQQSPRSLNNISKSNSSSQTFNIPKISKNPTASLVQQKVSLSQSTDISNMGISKKSSADIPLVKLPKDLNDSSSVDRSKKKRNVLIKTSATSSASALPISPQPTPSPFNEVLRSTHK